MTIGPGRYDDLCTLVREKVHADFAVVIIGGGERGGGFSFQTTDPKSMLVLPSILENIARTIREDNERLRA
jgi:hypothetical protein